MWALCANMFWSCCVRNNNNNKNTKKKKNIKMSLHYLCACGCVYVCAVIASLWKTMRLYVCTCLHECVTHCSSSRARVCRVRECFHAFCMCAFVYVFMIMCELKQTQRANSRGGREKHWNAAWCELNLLVCMFACIAVCECAVCVCVQIKANTKSNLQRRMHKALECSAIDCLFACVRVLHICK